MIFKKIQDIVLNKLLDKYEKSKTFTGTNQMNQSFGKRISELFSKYNDDAEYELFCDVNEAMHSLEALQYISITYERGDIINMVSLNVAKLQDIYEFVGREPKREEHSWLIDTMLAFESKVNNNPRLYLLGNYFKVQGEKISKNQKVEYYDGEKMDYVDLLTLVYELLLNENEIFIRDLSIKIFHDSKRVEKLETKAKSLLYQYGDYLDKDSVFEECNVLKTPTYVSVKGKAILMLGGQTIDLSKLMGDIALSTESLKELESVTVIGNRVVTVENLTSFHNYGVGKQELDDLVIYLGGFHNRAKRDFLIKLYEQNNDKEYRHFGDIDAGGFYILEHLKRKTGIPFVSLNMDINTLEKYMEHTKTLTVNDRKRLELLLSKLECDREVIAFMLNKDCKLEQEAVSELAK